MRTIWIALICAGALASCGQAGAPNAAPAQADASSTEPAGAEPQTSGLTTEMLVGRWGDNGDCSKDLFLNEDGTFTSSTGGSGVWLLNGDRVRMTGAGGTFEVGVEVLNGQTLLIRNADGSMGTSQRCDTSGK